MKKTLDNIGFYTLSDARAHKVATMARPALTRCEILTGGRCNFRCQYCRRAGGPDADPRNIESVLQLWIADGLQAVRFSGGEPTLWPHLESMVAFAGKYIPRVAISTNGSAPWKTYERLLTAGANDFSVSLDACCSSDGKRMSGGIDGAWECVVENIRRLSAATYVSVGVVITEENEASVADIVRFAAGLSVRDIRVIPAAQNDAKVNVGPLPIDGMPILKWRWDRLQAGKQVRGIALEDSRQCALVLDDMAVMNGNHYPCIIYLREGGRPVGMVSPTMREERARWYERHDSYADPICSRNCLDFCVAHNNRVAEAKVLNRICMY
jgi:MoaA/NifB/PqqE/SkfB family radical SAM enzyme